MVDKKEKDHTVPDASATQLPSIKQLIQESWELFRATAITYLKLFGLSIAILLLGGLIGILILLPLSFTAFGPDFSNIGHLTAFPLIIIVLLILWMIFYFLLIIAMGIIFPIVSIFILQEKKPSPLFSLIKQSKGYALPYFLTVVSSALFIIGGIMLFFIPGLFIGVFFVFILYEVVLEKQSGRSALLRSYILIKNHFWEVVARLFVLEIGLLIISSVLGRLAGGNWLLELVQFLFSIFSVWYSRAYLYLLYKQLRARTTIPAHISMRWIWIVSGVGWAFVILLLIGLALGASYLHGMQPSHMSRVSPGAV